MGGERQFETAADHRAVHRADDRDPAVLNALKRAAPKL